MNNYNKIVYAAYSLTDKDYDKTKYGNLEKISSKNMDADCVEAADELFNDLSTPLCKPQFNFSDMIIIKNALQVVRDSLLPELQVRVDLIIAELLKAEREVKNGN